MNNQILEYLLSIPKSKVTTYKNIAIIFNTHPRGVAQILKHNKYPEIYPCYKVICSDGSLGGYNLGVSFKIKKLLDDGIKIVNGKIDLNYVI